MSEAEVLLNSLTETVTQHEHPVPDTDTHFIIDPFTRQIENTTYNKTVLMQGDHNSERFTFELPRYVDGHDMSICNRVIIHFDNIDENGREFRSDVAYSEDLRTDPENPETVICSWLIKREATQLIGILSFSLQYLCVENDGTTSYEWNTDSYDGIEIRKSKNNGEAAVVEYTNVLEEWRSKIFGAGDSVMANIAAEGTAQVTSVQTESATQRAAIERKGFETLATIPEDYTEVCNMAEEAIRTKADSITRETSGLVAMVNDSSDDYIRGLNVYGKSTQVTTNGYQLFDARVLATVSKGGASITNNGDGSFTISGSGTLTENIATLKDYTHEESLRMLRLGMLHCPLTRTMPYCYVQIRNSSEIYFGLTHSRPSYEITQTILDDEGMFIRIGFYGGSGEEIVPGTIKPMLYQDGDGTWEPFSGGKASPTPDYPQDIVNLENPTVEICGKNLVRTNNNKDVTYEGLHFLITKGLSEVVLNGTTTKSYGYAISEGTYLAPGRYTMSVYGLNNVSAKYDQAYVMNTHTRKTVCAEVKTGSPVTFEITEGGVHRIDFLFAEGTTYNNATIRFQIEAGSLATDYEPCKQVQTITLPHTLHGIPVTTGGNYTDENSQQWICDEVDLERGIYIKRIGSKEFDGSEDEKWFVRNETPVIYYTEISDKRVNYEAVPNALLCSHFPVVSHMDGYQIECITETYYHTGNINILVNYNNGIGGLDGFIEYLQANPVTVQYILKNPVETPLTAAEIAAYRALKTNYRTTTVLNNTGAWMRIKYNSAVVGMATESAGEIFNDYENNTASGKHASARNRKTSANADFSDVSGYGSSTSKEATAGSSEGYFCQTNAPAGHSEGYESIVDAPYGHAQNHQTHVKAKGASTSGRGTIAGGEYQTVDGMYNVEDTEGKYAHITGGGTSDKDRKNIHTLDWEGNADFAGDVRSKGKKLATLDEIGGQPVVESEDYPGCYYRMVDGEKEWLNPPLIANSGEYRTTQRFAGSPVYVQVAAFDSLPTGTASKNVCSPGCLPIRIEGVAHNPDGSLHYPLPMSDGVNTRMYALLNSKGSLFVKSMSDYSNWTAVITLWYIK